MEKAVMISQLRHFIEINDDTMLQGPDIWQLLEPRVDGILETFYAKVNSFHVNASLTDDVIGKLIGKQKQHWKSLFSSQFNEEYANSVRRLGIRHREINLDLMWYVLGYAALKIAFIEVIIDSQMPPIKKGRLVKALEKYIAFDMALALSTYGAVVFD
jgi:hypothetical protein